MITLARLEQEVARRTGPFFQAAQDSQVPTTSTAISAYMPTLRSTALLGGPENLWLLRRGVLSDGTPTAYNPQDRTRMVQSFDSSAGRVVIDRNWYSPMASSELADLTHLHPEQELRPSVLAGLRRCFFEDTLQALVTSGYGDIDLTFQYPWLISPSQVVGAQYGWNKPWATAPFRAYMQSGHVMLGGTSGSYAPANLWVTALRPVWSWVNEDDSLNGPVEDDNELDVDLDYAASAGHIEAWHLFPSRLFAAAAGNNQATQQMAASEFSRQSMIWSPSTQTQPDYAFKEVVTLPLQGGASF